MVSKYVCWVILNGGKIDTVINLHLYTNLVLFVPLEQMDDHKSSSKLYKEVKDRQKALGLTLSKAESTVHRAIEEAYRQDLLVSCVYTLC